MSGIARHSGLFSGASSKEVGTEHKLPCCRQYGNYSPLVQEYTTVLAWWQSPCDAPQ